MKDESRIVASVMHCIIRRESSILFHRRTVTLRSDDGRLDKVGYWELPLAKKLPQESLEDCAERVAYDQVGLFAETIVMVRAQKEKFATVLFRDHHYYALLEEVDGKVNQDLINPDQQDAQGTVQWIDIEFLTLYAMRRETQAMVYTALARD